jgi:hypothetical protein
MKRILTLGVPAAILAVTMAALEGACNNVGDCPTAASIAPGGACSGDNLECPYTLQSPSPACDGTDVDGGLATSCVCTNGTWACPSPVSCDAGGTGDDGGGGDAETVADDATSE